MRVVPRFAHAFSHIKKTAAGRLFALLCLGCLVAGLVSALAAPRVVGVQATEAKPAAQPEKPALPQFTARENWPQGREEGEVLCGEKVVLRLRAPLGGLSPYERAMIAAKRLNDFVEDYTPNGPLRVAQVNEQWIIQGGAINIVTCDAQTAKLNNLTPEELARLWLANIREALKAAGQTPAPAAPAQPAPAEPAAPAAPQPPPPAEPAPPPPPAPPAEAIPPAASAAPSAVPPPPENVKLVPVIAVVGGEQVGTAAVTGEQAVLDALKTVAALEGTYQGVVRIHALVPTASDKPTGADPRLAGATIIGVRLTKKPSSASPTQPAEGGGEQ